MNAHVRSPAIQKIPKMVRFHHDFETYSEVDIKKVGASRYSQHASTEVLMLAYARSGGEIKQWVPEEGQLLPAEVEDAMLDDRIMKFAWNKPFEWNIWKHVVGIDTAHTVWRDPMVLAFACSLPGKLEKAGPIANVPEHMLKQSGTRLINWFSKPRPKTFKRVYWYEKPELWEEYKDYNIHDVMAERKIWLNLSPYDLPQHEWDLYALDQEINTRGIPINMGMVYNAVEMRDEIVTDRLKKLSEITGLENPNSGTQLLPWLQDQGYPFEDLKAGHVKQALRRLDDAVTGGESHPQEIEALWETLSLRAEVSQTASKKFDALANMTDNDNRLRNSHQFAGAGRTWRWAGRGFQVQNLKKAMKGLDGLEWEETPGGHQRVCGGTQITAADHIATMSAETFELLYAKPMDALSGAVRTVVQAPDGYVFVDADLAAIENVGLGWVSGDQKILNVFKQKRDPYIDFATFLYKRPYQELHDEWKIGGDKGKRTVSKPGVLGCGYMLSAGDEHENYKTGEIEATGLLGYAWNMGVPLTKEQATLSVDVWRDTYKDAVQFWWDIDKAVRKCIQTGKPTQLRDIRFDRKGPFLRIILPSGRCLHYFSPQMQEWKMPWGKYKMSITYEQVENYRWDRVSTHPGKLTENVVQAIARDLLAHGMVLAAKENLPIVMHVHDQVLALVKEDEADAALKTLLDCMTVRPSWSPDIPISAAGHISKWFIKD
jgi:DNA polymerase